MAYVKTNWVDNSTPINANNLNKIENGIEENTNNIEEINTTLSSINNYVLNEEVQIGTFLGSPMYRKLIHINQLPNAQVDTYTLSDYIQNMEIPIDAYGYATNGTSFHFINNTRPSSPGSAIGCFFDVLSNGIYIDTGSSDRSDYEAYIIVEYTKQYSET